ncbi:hypothetical protein [Nocardia sp. NPDC051981]|uniref:hypothetical protein n=1 Tax=Nocardia sp. NPDC051981 TaxID=3155417 RepID=UPI003433C473
MQDSDIRSWATGDSAAGLGVSAAGQKNERLAAVMAEVGLRPKGLANRMRQYSEQDGGRPVHPKHTNVGRYIDGVNRPSQRSLDVMLSVLSIEARRPLSAADIGYLDEPSGKLEDEVKPSAPPADLIALPFETVDSEYVDHLKEMLDARARMDALTGPRYVLGTLQSELQLVQDLCGKARGEMRSELLEVGARFCEFAGWLYQDSGDLKCARHWTMNAMDYAEEIGDPHLMSYILQRRSNIATENGYAPQGLGLANAALRGWDEITPELRAVALRQQANAYAMTGEADECRKALDRAMEQVLAIDDPSPLALYCTPSYIEMEAAHSWARLGEPYRAIETYTMGLDEWPKSQRRDQGLCAARLASAYIDANEFELAAQTGMKAASLIRCAPSARAIGVLRELSKRVRPVRNEALREFESAAVDLLSAQSTKR